MDIANLLWHVAKTKQIKGVETVTVNHLMVDEKGRKLLYSGNEAFARGGLEANIQIAAGYPGTPSSEIIESLASAAKEAGIYVEWSVNEKVAFEVAYAAAVAGIRSMVTFKSVGINVAADSLMVANSAGVEGGFVIICADDPYAHSSQNEQDCRLFAKMAEIPLLEPANPQEAKECMSLACELSEASKLPVIVRSVTRLSHVRGDVELGSLPAGKRTAQVDEAKVFSGFPGLERHVEHHRRLNSIRDLVNEFPLNKTELTGQEKLGLITSGLGYEYGKEVIHLLELEGQVAVLKLGVVNPLPRRLVSEFVQKFDRVLILEDGFPFIEEELKKLCYDRGIKTSVLGKLSGHLPQEGELTPEIVGKTMDELTCSNTQHFQLPAAIAEVIKTASEPPSRVLSLCPGCAHMSMWYAMKQAVKNGKRDVRRGAVVCGDIGCYGLGLYPPYNMFNTHVCMGASIGVANGMSKLNLDKPVFAYLGEGTFFHAGLSALQSAVFNKAKMVVLIQDNQSIAMTGHQECPSMGRNLMGDEVPVIKVEDIARAMGVPYVKTVDAYDLDEVVNCIDEAMKVDGPAVIVGRRKCAELAKREIKRQGRRVTPPTNDHNLCNGCKICVNGLHCPALIWERDTKKVTIDKILCVGCSLCAQVCPQKSIIGGEGIANV
ncbi:MAG: indolepyruvate ferredoxin oxidoreductase subunit alpha [Thermincola sp.]|jgi:indolepyruvate ferredoxin oxidoreductase alpha subunit|nr:indolepyruvate ferredoxin oxidoreductase subunit alpha [Thermincola sp.]MDT3704234.1 indolepyruvate ferredoxin oxidoreductase subunit alpha [Thermincola sp.]